MEHVDRANNLEMFDEAMEQVDQANNLKMFDKALERVVQTVNLQVSRPEAMDHVIRAVLSFLKKGDGGEVPPVSACFCGEIFPTKSREQVTRHFFEAHLRTGSVEPISSSSLSCFCGAVFASETGASPHEDLAKHFLKEHVNAAAVSHPPPSECIYCSQNFESPEQLAHHTVHVHICTDAVEFHCPRCKSDISDHVLEVHQAVAHPGLCILCLRDDLEFDDHDVCTAVLLDALLAAAAKKWFLCLFSGNKFENYFFNFFNLKFFCSRVQTQAGWKNIYFEL